MEERQMIFENSNLLVIEKLSKLTYILGRTRLKSFSVTGFGQFPDQIQCASSADLFF
jgi:hypothetical protein